MACLNNLFPLKTANSYNVFIKSIIQIGLLHFHCFLCCTCDILINELIPKSSFKFSMRLSVIKFFYGRHWRKRVNLKVWGNVCNRLVGRILRVFLSKREMMKGFVKKNRRKWKFDSSKTVYIKDFRRKINKRLSTIFIYQNKVKYSCQK